MFNHRRARSLVKTGFALLGWPLVVMYLLVVTGVSIPVPLPSGKDLSQAFPCMFGSCGCQTATQCWNNCCCLTRAEQLAWAHANQVTPPDHVLAGSSTAVDLTSVSPASSTKASCCSTSSRSSAAKPVVLSCCSSKESVDSANCVADAPESPPHIDEPQQTAGVVLLQMLKCQGIAETWTGVGISVVAAPVQFDVALDVVVPVYDRSLLAAAPLKSAPPVPPPRSVWI